MPRTAACESIGLDGTAAAAVTERFAIIEAGRVSANDPRATFSQR
jgi:hypothetical protein